MKSPLVSILMPVFNALPYLEACLNSIRKQSFTDWELITVNDFSTDGSRELLEHFTKIDQRISVHNNTSKGIIPALREALKHSNGRFITRMDADDLMPENKLRLMSKVLQQEGKGTLVTGLVEYFSDDTLHNGYRRYADWLNKVALEKKWRREVYRECVIPSPCWMVHRTDLEHCGGFSPDTYPEDYDLVFRFLQSGLKVETAREVLHYWRDHPERSSRTLPQYADQAYFDLKVPYFLKIDRDPGRELFVWGAGKKGKKVVKLLQASGQTIRWVCETPSKWGKLIYGIAVENFRALEKAVAPQVLVLVSNPVEQKKIQRFLEERTQINGLSYYFFV